MKQPIVQLMRLLDYHKVFCTEKKLTYRCQVWLPSAGRSFPIRTIVFPVHTSALLSHLLIRSNEIHSGSWSQLLLSPLSLRNQTEQLPAFSLWGIYFTALPLPPSNKTMIQAFWENKLKCSAPFVLCALSCCKQLSSKQYHISVSPLGVSFSVTDSHSFSVLDTPDAAQNQSWGDGARCRNYPNSPDHFIRF